jgi:uncharacterized membrane protein YfhO
VRVDRGEHRVEFRYLPKTFIIGLIGSLASCIIISAGLFIRYARISLLAKKE